MEVASFSETLVTDMFTHTGWCNFILLKSLTAPLVINAHEESMAVILYFCTEENLQQAGVSLEIEKNRQY